MGHTAISVTKASSVTLNLACEAKANYSNFETFNKVVDTKTSIIKMGPNILNVV